MDKVTSAETVRQYYDSPEVPRQFVGTHPMGGGGFLELYYRHYFEVQHLKKIVRFNPSLSVLELGCGNGRWVVSLAPLVQNYTAVDFSQRALDIAQEDVEARGITNVEFHKCSVTEFSSDRLYDVIYFSGVSPHLEDDEIKRILDNLSPSCKPNTVIIDRSTVNYQEREINSTKNYYAIYRKPIELDELFRAKGFQLSYQKRSYRFLRASHQLFFGPLNRITPFLVLRSRPLSFYVLLGISFVADLLHPIPFEGGNRSHDFFLFKRCDVA